MILDTTYNPVSLQLAETTPWLSMFSTFKYLIVLPSAIATEANIGSPTYWLENIKLIPPSIETIEDKSEDSASIKLTNGKYITIKNQILRYRLNFRTTFEVYEKIKTLNGSTDSIAFVDHFNNLFLQPVMVDNVLNYYGIVQSQFCVNTFKFGSFSIDISLDESNDFSKFRNYQLDFNPKRTEYYQNFLLQTGFPFLLENGNNLDLQN